MFDEVAGEPLLLGRQPPEPVGDGGEPLRRAGRRWPGEVVGRAGPELTGGCLQGMDEFFGAARRDA